MRGHGRTNRVWIAAACALATTFAAKEAAAEWNIGVEPRFELLFGNDFLAGPGLLFDVGYALDLYPIMVIPQIALTAAVYPFDDVIISARGTAGIRVGITLEVEPSAYFHVGYGLLSEPGGRYRPYAHNFTIDAGVSLEKRIERSLTLGGSLGYQGFIGDSSQHGLTGGFHIGFWL